MSNNNKSGIEKCVDDFLTALGVAVAAVGCCMVIMSLTVINLILNIISMLTPTSYPELDLSEHHKYEELLQLPSTNDSQCNTENNGEWKYDILTLIIIVLIAIIIKIKYSKRSDSTTSTFQSETRQKIEKLESENATLRKSIDELNNKLILSKSTKTNNGTATLLISYDCQYSWYYRKHSKFIEVDSGLIDKLESLKVGDRFHHSYNYGMLSKYKYTKLGIALVVEKNSITRKSNSVFRRKKTQIEWKWKADDGSFQIYPQSISNQIQKAKINETVMIDIDNDNNYKYEVRKISKDKGEQRNINTNKIRSIICCYNTKIDFDDDDMKEFEVCRPTKFYSKCDDLTNKNVEKMFYETLGNTNYEIISIKNIMNKTMSIHYELCLKSKCNKYHALRDKVELLLWHGSSFKTLECVIQTGFDRSYNVRGAYGKGTYFAKHSGYSVNNGYCVQHSDGYFYILLCRVIVGESLVGNSRMDKIPKKGNGDEYDSLIDKKNNPLIFVSWRDYMGLPLYLIKFKRKS